MKYIDADKLIAEIKRYENTAIDAYDPLGEDADYWHGKVVACEDLKTLITSLQQEQPDLPSGEDVMTMCNQILIDWVKEGKTPEEVKSREEAHIRFFELYDNYLMQELPEVDLEKEVQRWKNKHGVVGMDDLWLNFARYFYELGLKARKEDKK